MSVKLLLYCTKAKPYLIYDYYDNSCGKCITADKIESYHLNGKIVAECECEKVEKIVATKWSVGCGCNYYQFETKDLLKKSCLNWIDLTDYLQDQNGYGLHLSNVKMFDEPYDINECYQYKKWQTRLKNAPQNMCEVYGKNGDHYILISIRPEHLCKILNGEKTIEVRKKILNSLKEMLEDE